MRKIDRFAQHVRIVVIGRGDGADAVFCAISHLAFRLGESRLADNRPHDVGTQFGSFCKVGFGCGKYLCGRAVDVQQMRHAAHAELRHESQGYVLNNHTQEAVWYANSVFSDVKILIFLVKRINLSIFANPNAQDSAYGWTKIGLMAEWLGKGLQNLVQRFESASDLQKPLYKQLWRGFLFFYAPFYVYLLLQ